MNEPTVLESWVQSNHTTCISYVTDRVYKGISTCPTVLTGKSVNTGKRNNRNIQFHWNDYEDQIWF